MLSYVEYEKSFITSVPGLLTARLVKFLYLNITVAGPVELDPEYQLIVEANNLTVEIDNEISKYWIAI